MEENRIAKLFFLSTGTIALIGIAALSFYDISNSFYYDNLQPVAEDKVESATSQEISINVHTSQGDSPEEINPKEVREPGMSFRSAVSMKIDGSQRYVLFEKDKNLNLPIASLAKLMTALVVLENYNLNRMITISESAMAQEGEQGNLKVGEELSVKNLLYITLMESSNRSAKALSEVEGESEFVAMMNEQGRRLGLFNTYFVDSTGLDPNTRSTAEDIVQISWYLFENYPLFREITGLKEYDLYLPNGQFHHRLVNTNKLLWQDSIVSGKTGWTDYARGCFVVIQKSQYSSQYYINVILGSEDRFSDMKDLLNLIKS